MSCTAIRNRRDALVWELVDARFGGADTREAVEAFFLAYARAQAAYYLTDGDWLISLLAETDPTQLGRERRSAA